MTKNKHILLIIINIEVLNVHKNRERLFKHIWSKESWCSILMSYKIGFKGKKF